MTSKRLLDDATVKVATTAANFPALVHAWDYDGCDFTANTITDPINGAVLTLLALDDTGSSTFDPDSVTAATGIIAPDAVNVVMIAVYPYAINNNMDFELGNTQTYGMMARPNNEYVATNNGGDYHTFGTANFSANPVANAACGISIDWANNATEKYTADSGMTAVANASGVATNSISEGITQANIDGITTPADLPNASGQKVAGFYYFKFTSGIPKDVAAAVAWMAANPGYVYPAWKGRA